MIYKAKLVVSRVTEFYAKKLCIDELVELFRNEQNNFIRCKVFWEDGAVDFIARRTAFHAMIGVRYKDLTTKGLSDILPKNKKEYMECFEYLYKNKIDESDRKV